MVSNSTDASVLDKNLWKVVRRGFIIDGSELWLSNTQRLFDAAMRAFSMPAANEVFIGGKTQIEGELLDIVIGIKRDGAVRTMTKEAYERYEL